MNKIKEKIKLYKEKKNKLNEYLKEEDEMYFEKHKNDLDILEISIYERFKKEYSTKDDDILNINYEINTEKSPSGIEVINFYENYGFFQYKKYIIKRSDNIDNKLKIRFPGMHPSISLKQTLSSILNDKNPIINFSISREDFKKIIDECLITKEEIPQSFGYHVKYNFKFK